MALDVHPRPERVYSYERFSSPEQLLGDSLRRQTELAERYATQHGLEIDRSLNLQDLGISAFHGANFHKGALGEFLKAVDNGIVPRGSRLLVENLDRLTRENPYDAQFLLREIFRRDISVVTLDDGRVYSETTLREDIVSMMLLQMTTFRAHDEQKKKSERLKSAWVNKRARVGEKILTERAPAWLRVEDGKFVAIPERAAIVKRIFEMAAEGIGLERITRTFNEEGIKPFGKATHWHRSYILKIIDSPAPLGRFVPHTVDHIRDPNVIGKTRKIRQPGEVIDNYFPPVVPEDLFQKVQAMRQRRAPATRSSTIRNVLAGLSVCAMCNGSMTRVMKGKKSRPYLVCSKAKAGAGCRYQAHPYDPIEEAVKQGIQPLPGKAGRANIRPLFLVELSPAATELDLERVEVERQIMNVMSLVLSSPQPPVALRKKLDELERRKREIYEQLRTTPNVEVARGAATRLMELKEWNPNEVNSLLRQIFSEVVVRPGELVMKRKDGHHTVVKVQ